MTRQPVSLASRQVPTFILGWLIADVAIGFVHVMNLTLLAWLHRPMAFLDMDYEVNLPTWYSSLQLGVLGLLFAGYAWLHWRRRSPRAWLLAVPALLALFLSLDELAQIHERLRPFTRTELLPFSGAWMLVAAPVFLAAVGLTYWVTRHFWAPPRARQLLVAGIALYVFSAAALEIPHNFMEPNSIPHLAVIFVEEMGEMLAVTLMLWGIWELIHAHGGRLLATDEHTASGLPPAS